jgi:glycosyltransferase involved in cell wall biosynthesis
LLKSIKEISPDIVHTQANKATAMVSKIKPFLSSKFVATLHSQKRNIKAYENFDYIIGVSHRVLASLDNPSKIVIYNGIDTPKVTYDELFWDRFGISKESFVISAIGRLESVKNFPMLIEAISELPVELVIVGDGSKRDELEEMVKMLNISSKVHFLGFREDVNDILYHSRLSVISSDREGFSYVMAEALLLEKPIISTDVGDMKKILPKEYVVPVGDVGAMKNSILKFLNNYDDSLDEFRGSFEFARENFILSSMVQNIKKVYDLIIKEEYI